MRGTRPLITAFFPYCVDGPAGIERRGTVCPRRRNGFSFLSGISAPRGMRANHPRAGRASAEGGRRRGRS
jgi:hypothetical protein